MSNGTQVVVSAVNPADLATKFKDGTQVVHVPSGALSSIDWASKLKVGQALYSSSYKIHAGPSKKKPTNIIYIL
jgi:hypothetical protein